MKQTSTDTHNKIDDIKERAELQINFNDEPDWLLRGRQEELEKKRIEQKQIAEICKYVDDRMCLDKSFVLDMFKMITKFC
jgi:hypothetical protein